MNRGGNGIRTNGGGRAKALARNIFSSNPWQILLVLILANLACGAQTDRRGETNIAEAGDVTRPSLGERADSHAQSQRSFEGGEGHTAAHLHSASSPGGEYPVHFIESEEGSFASTPIDILRSARSNAAEGRDPLSTPSVCVIPHNYRTSVALASAISIAEWWWVHSRRSTRSAGPMDSHLDPDEDRFLGAFVADAIDRELKDLR